MAKFLMFDRSEFESRWNKCQIEMEKAGIDVLLLSLPSNIYYMTGYRTQLFVSNFRPFICIMPKDGEPVLGVPNLELHSAEKESWIEDVRCWGPGGEADDPISWVKKIFKEKKLTNTVVGLELDDGQRIGMLQVELDAIYESFPKCSFKSCAEPMWNLRMIKSEKELEYMREASRITDVGYTTLINTIKAGMTEKDIQRIVAEAMVKEGGELQGFIVINSGPKRYNMMNPWASNRILEDGDMVIMDWGAVYNGYWSDLTRGFFIGSVTDRQKELYNATLELRDIGARAVKPGVEIGEVDRQCMQRIEEMGYTDLIRHRTGHSLGIEVHESPSISSDNETIMKPGMCLTIEPSLYDWPDVGSFRIEDIVVVTENGSETISHCTRELIVIK